MARGPHRLTRLKIGEVSLVDAPANSGALALLYKRKDIPLAATKTPGPLDRLLAKLGIGKAAAATSADLDPDVYADAASAVVDKATTALSTSLASIYADAAVTDKDAAVSKSMAEFRAYVGEQVADQIEKAMGDVALAGDVIKGKDDTMPTDAEQIATLTKQLAALTDEVNKAKLPPAHAQYAKDSGMDEDATAAFAAKSSDDREAQMAAKPVKKADTTILAVELAKRDETIATLMKSVASFEQERELATFRKRASEIGVGEAQAEVILKASKGDPTAFTSVLDMLKSATAAARTGSVFAEFGSVGKGAGTAALEVQQAAETLIKADPKLSLIMARVAVRKAQPELAQRERDEERAGQPRVA